MKTAAVGKDISAELVSISLGVYCAGLLLTFGYRTFAQYARTGSSGWAGVRKDAGLLERIGAGLFVLALLGGAASPWLVTKDIVSAVELPIMVAVFGLGLEVLGLIAVFLSQNAMGDAWRIGVDPTAQTTLVTDGAFGWVRNPVFTAMIAAQLGVLVVAPNTVGLAATLALVVAVQLQVRVVEEPYLLRAHAEYRAYAGRVGRFVPGVGTIDPDFVTSGARG